MLPLRVRLVLFTLFLLFLAGPCVSRAYTPGSGTVYSADFEEELDEDWEMGNGIGQPSPWTRELDGGDFSLYADGIGPFAISPTKHWARHFLHPVRAEGFALALEYRAELGAGYVFDLEIEQRAPELRKIRLRIDGDGRASLARTEDGVYVEQCVTAAGFVPALSRRWIRLALDEGPGGSILVHARFWSGSAESEPASGWDLEFQDDRRTIERVHRFELTADGPRGVETWVDDLDAFGDAGAGVESSIRTIWVAEWSHLDIGFTAPPDDIEAFAKEHLDQVLENLDADPGYRWTIESSWWLARWWERSTDEEREEMVSRLREGRIDLCAGYANLHTTTCGEEELVRSIYWASRFAREHGIPLRVFITDDVPGSTFALPELLSRAGIDYYVGGMNTSFGGKLDEPNHGTRPFWWVGPDGSRVLSWITFDSYAEGFDYGFGFFDTLEDLYHKLGKKLPEQEEAGYPWDEMLLLRAFDNHYQGLHVKDLVDQWNATYETPRFRLASPAEFLDHMLAVHGADAFPEYAGDFGAAWSRSHANAQHTEEWVRRAHREGRNAEALLACAAPLDGLGVPLDNIDFLYRRELEVDEHSGAGGWPGYFTPEEMDRNNRIHLGYAIDARDTAVALLDEGTRRVAELVPSRGDAIVVENPLGFVRDGWVRIELPQETWDREFRLVDRASGEELVYQRFPETREILFRAEGLPAFGYRVYDLLAGAPTAEPEGMLAATSTSLENDFLRVTIDPADGAVTSIVEKATGRELVDGSSAYRFNQLASNVKQEYDRGQPPVAEPPDSASVTLVTDGPLLAEIRVDLSGTAHRQAFYRLYRGDDRFELENVLDRDAMPYVPRAIGVRAYMVTLPFDVHDFAIRSETTTRFLDPVGDSFARSSVFDWHNAEHVLWFGDGAGGVLHACDAVDAFHFENLSSLVSSAWSTGDALLLPRYYDRADEYEFEDGHVGSYEIEPDTSPEFHYVHHVRATGATFDPVAAARFGFGSLEPPRARLVGKAPGDLPDSRASFLRVEPDGVLAYTLKAADDGDGWIVRVLELRGEETTARLGSDVFVLEDAERVEMDEEGGEPLGMDGNEVLVPLGPYETATVRVRVRASWAPLSLSVTKGNDAVHLSWEGGVAPYTLERAADARFTDDRETLVDEEDVSAYDDPVLGDGRTWFYLAR